MSTTPRTETQIIRSNLDEVADDCVPASFARQLESENAKLREKLDAACGFIRTAGRNSLADRLSP